MGFVTIEQINNSKELQEQYKKEYGQEWNGLNSGGLKFESKFKFKCPNCKRERTTNEKKVLVMCACGCEMKEVLI